MNYDVVIVGGGPAGLSAALTLGRGRRRVLVCDAGPRFEGAAPIPSALARGGTRPEEFRRLARVQLAPYPSVEIRDARVDSIGGSPGAFDVVALTHGQFTVPGELAARLARAGIRLEQRRIAHFVTQRGQLESVALVGSGAPVPLQVLFARPPRHQVPLVAALDLTLTPDGYVLVDKRLGGTSRPGVYAGGELTASTQSAVMAAGSAVVAAAMLDQALMVDRATAGATP
jgi:thioredoxin reductase